MIDRLPREAQRRLAYDLREIVDKAFEDLDFIFSQAEFRWQRDRRFYYPFEVAMPRDPKVIRKTLAQLAEWKQNIELVESALLGLGLRYLRG